MRVTYYSIPRRREAKVASGAGGGVWHELLEYVFKGSSFVKNKKHCWQKLRVEVQCHCQWQC